MVLRRRRIHRLPRAPLKPIRRGGALPGMPLCLARVPRQHYSFYVAPEWKYGGRGPPYVGGFVIVTNRNPHLVLCDRAGLPRFTLGFEERGNNLIIDSIQRERTVFKPPLEKSGDWEWDRQAERAEARQFKAELGMHPGEFIVSLFLWLNREAIRKGKRVYLQGSRAFGSSIEVYAPLIARFFERKPKKVPLADSAGRFSEFFCHELSPQKRRAREILGPRERTT